MIASDGDLSSSQSVTINVNDIEEYALQERFHAFTHDEVYIGLDTANSYGFYDAPDSINEARGFSVVVDPFSRDDIYGNPIHIYYSEYHLAPNIPGYGFLTNLQAFLKLQILMFIILVF